MPILSTKRLIKKTFTLIEKLIIEAWFVLLLLLFGTLFIHDYEWISYFNSFYFSVITLSGIGYGDIVPVTMVGKIVAMVYGIIWIPLFVVAWWLIVEAIKGYNGSDQS